MKRRKLIVGCGYLGTFLAKEWRQQGLEVTGVVRSPRRVAELSSLATEVIVCDVSQEAFVLRAEQFDTVVFAVGFHRQSNGTLNDSYLRAVKNVVRQFEAHPIRFLYISTTGVYGNQSGVLNEESPCMPQRDTSYQCWLAEQYIQASPIAPRAIVLRLAGLYGPGRVPRWKELLAGEPLAVDPHSWMNIIRVEDAARLICAAAARAPTPRVYHIADGHTVRRGDFFRYMASVFGLAPPRFRSPPADDTQTGLSPANKQLDISRMLCELDVPLQFPSYREGLADLASHGKPE